MLASASRARLGILRGAGIDPIVQVSEVDEDAVADALPHGTSPEDVVVALARAKALDVAAAIPEHSADAVVVGCDSMLLVNGQLQGKPHTPEVAKQRWKDQAGRSAELLTGHCVLRVRDGEIVADAAECSGTVIHFAKPTDDELDAYIATGEPLQVAGSFTLDGLGGWFVDRIDGDPSSVIGIGLPLLRGLLEDVGVSVTQLWRDAAQ
ncbi:Maf-like protein [Nocardia camponoti]|uniref:Nucleoside triphosphate pyrophosphatase n=1 Tax=Nocardia camponoti TaxID=1616106 RepID=A0A917QMG3_9NOCA|nr:Maf-like protein [Nocardia camponoti]